MASQMYSAIAANAEADETLLRPVSPTSPSSSSREAQKTYSPVTMDDADLQDHVSATQALPYPLAPTSVAPGSIHNEHETRNSLPQAGSTGDETAPFVPLQSLSDSVGTNNVPPEAGEGQPSNVTQHKLIAQAVSEDALSPQAGHKTPKPPNFKSIEQYWIRCGPWRWDFLALAFACALLVADIAILASYNGLSLSQWHASISINTIVSTISTVAMFTLMNPLGGALGQCKWLLFSRSGRSLSHLAHLDGASRGPYGSIKLFYKGNWYGSLPSVGALLMVVTLTVNPFMQQLIHFQFRDVRQGVALLPAAFDYGPTGVGGFFAANLTMKAAAYAGIVSPLDSTFNMTSSCPSGNCTWPAFQTLGVCSSCTNLTDQVKRLPIDPESFEGGGPSNFYLPNGSNLTTKETIHSQGLTFMDVSTTAHMYSERYRTVNDFTFNNLSIAYADRGSLIIDLLILRLRGLSNSGDDVTFAQECVLQYCVKNISASQRNGELIETEHDSWTNNSEPARKFYLGYLQSDATAWIPLYFLQPPGQERVFRVGHAAQVQMTSWLDRQLRGTATRQPPDGGEFFGSDQIQGIDAAFDQDETGLQQAMVNVANAMTTALRMSSNESAEGDMFVSEAYISIQWAWITLPALLYILAVCFVVTVAWRCGHTGDVRVHVWKNSLVAALFHGLDPELLARVGRPDEQELIDEAAKDLKVKLTSGMHVLRLEEEESHELGEWR